MAAGQTEPVPGQVRFFFEFLQPGFDLAKSGGGCWRAEQTTGNALPVGLPAVRFLKTSINILYCMNPTDELEELALFLMLAHSGSVRPQSGVGDRIAAAAYLHDSGKEHAYWQDCVMGLASTMSFRPIPLQPTFHDSDHAALASDWLNVQSDLNQVWREIVAADSKLR
jgi:hypothetical protein